MFCTNCGKEIINTAKFCNFCGMPVKNMAASVPINTVQPAQSTQSVQPVQPVTQLDRTAPDYMESADITATDNATEAPESTSEIPTVESASECENAEDVSEPAVETITADDNAIPTPNAIPTYGTSTPVYPTPPVYPNPPANTVPITQEIKAESAPENKSERKYTLGHIMMCLAGVAVMAIVAGVFAGLYFSVV